MMSLPKQEPWLRGPIAGVAPILQPVAHSLTQLLEDLLPVLDRLTDEDVWKRPGSSAPIGYHLAHSTGSMDRLLTYARGESLSASQWSALEAEKKCMGLRPTLAELRQRFQSTVERGLTQVRSTPLESVLEVRLVGRARLPSNTIGLLYQAAEHSARHAGQIVTICRVLGH